MTSPNQGYRAGARIVATIEARMTSSRLPGKVMADVSGHSLLGMLITRVKRAQTVGAICLATTTNPSDDCLVDFAKEAGIGYYRGPEDDVLARVLDAAGMADADIIVELTADCPFVDPMLVDACIIAYCSQEVDYVSNCFVRSFPLGLDVKVFSTATLREVSELTDEPADREHVSLYIYEHPDRYRLLNLEAVGDLRRPDWRWTVDTDDDLDFVRRVVAELGHDFSAIDAVRFLDTRPEIVAINELIRQKPVR